MSKFALIATMTVLTVLNSTCCRLIKMPWLFSTPLLIAAQPHYNRCPNGAASAAITAVQRFWVKARQKGIIAYQATDFELPQHKEITHELLMERAKLHWERWGVQGKEFFSGAELYRCQDNFGLAAFLLHQSVEGTLKALIQAILGYRVQMHNLSKLLRIALLFTDDLKSVFNLDTTEGEQMFTLLQTSYSQSRYSNEFNPDGKSVLALSKTVKKMITVAGKIYLQYAGKKGKDV